MVELEATGASGAPGTNTVFLNNTAVQNMDFVSASAFKREAEISAKGYPLPPGKLDQVFDLRLTTREEVLRRDQVAAADSQAAQWCDEALATAIRRLHKSAYPFRCSS